MKRLIIISSIFIFLSGCTMSRIYNEWKGGVIPYQIDSSFSEDEKTIIRQSMDTWEQATGKLSFIEKTDEKLFISIVKWNRSYSKADYGCSPVNDNYIKISSDEVDEYVITHELGHTIGLKHEHQRPDRDDYVDIKWNNIIDSCKDQFDIERAELYDDTQFDYDYESIMHYDPYTFSKNYLPTITGIDYTGDIGGYEITLTDIAKVNLIY